MEFYDLSKEERARLVEKITETVKRDLENGNVAGIRRYASNNDTYVRKNTYLIIGRLYRGYPDIRQCILVTLKSLFEDEDKRVRQTVVYALGEIGKTDADKVLGMLETALKDKHVRNAVVGALKQMSASNPQLTLRFAKKFLHHPDPIIRRTVIHGIELRGRTHPEEILPLLAELQNDPDKNVKKMMVHVLGQISYKKGCLEKVVSSLKNWENKKLVDKAVKEILSVHKRYERFSARYYKEAKEYVEQEFNM